MNATDKTFVHARVEHHITVGCAALRCSRETYLGYYRAGVSAARYAIKDLHDQRAGVFPRNGLTDAEAIQRAELRAAASACSISFSGNREASRLDSAAAALTEIGLRRTFEREAA